VKAVSPKPVNVLVGGNFITVAELAALGVRRVSVGGALARTAWTGFMAAAKEISEQGVFGAFAGAVPMAKIEAGLGFRSG
jgi:2-methylisocitrate lyase-like PEP mutase family enzyme